MIDFTEPDELSYEEQKELIKEFLKEKTALDLLKEKDIEEFLIDHYMEDLFNLKENKYNALSEKEKSKIQKTIKDRFEEEQREALRMDRESAEQNEREEAEDAEYRKQMGEDEYH